MVIANVMCDKVIPSCLHSFCSDCIEECLRMFGNECPVVMLVMLYRIQRMDCMS